MMGVGVLRSADVARHELVSQLATRLVGAGRRSFVLRGPAGIGKTHLADQIVAELDAFHPASRPAIRRVSGGEAQRHLEFGALLHLLHLDEAPATTEFALVQRLRRGLVEQGKPTILLVDDIGLLDVKSAAVIESIVRAGDLVAIATERTTSSGERDYGHHMSSVLDDMFDPVMVPPIDPSLAAELVTSLAGPGEVGSVRRIVALGEGNPLALRELVASADASGAMRHRDGLWYLDGFVPTGATLTQLVDSHLARLAPEEWDLLRTMVIAGSVPRRVLARIDVTALEQIERAGIAGGDPSEVLHPLYATVIRQGLQGEESRRLCAKLASAVGPDDGVDPARLARWLLESGAEIDDTTARRGAAAALGRWENRLARDLLSLIAEPTTTDLVQSLWAHANDGDIEGAVALAADAVSSASTDAERVDAGLARAELFILQLGRGEVAYELLDRLRDSLTQPDQRARVEAAAAMYMRMTGRGTLAEAYTRAAVAEGSESDAARLSILLADSFGKVFTGQFDAAAPVIVAAYEYADRCGEPHNAVRISVVDAIRQLLSGRLDLAGELIDGALRAADVSAVRPAHAAWLALAAQSAAMSGDLDLARRRSGEAVHAAEHVDDIGAGGFVRGEWRAILLESDLPAVTHPDESPLGCGRADVRARAEGDPDLDELAVSRARSALRAGYRLWAPWIAMEAVRQGAAPKSCRFVEEIAGSTDGPLPAAFVDHAVGSLDGDVARVDAAAKVLDGLGAHALALDAAVTALDHLASDVDLGAEDALVPLRRRIVVLDRRCPLPPRTARRVAAIAERVGMPTDRQIEIATLVADGRTSKEVAAQLVVSARTVDNHLAAVYRKFGVSGRAQLADLF